MEEEKNSSFKAVSVARRILYIEESTPSVKVSYLCGCSKQVRWKTKKNSPFNFPRPLTGRGLGEQGAKTKRNSPLRIPRPLHGASARAPRPLRGVQVLVCAKIFTSIRLPAPSAGPYTMCITHPT